MSWWSDLLDKIGQIDPVFEAAKDGAYRMAKYDSQGVESLARKLGWDGVVAEAQKNQQNPGHAIGKAAQTALTWYLGGPAWSGAGETANAGATAAQLAAQQAATQSAYNGLAQGGGMFGNALGQTAAEVAKEGAKTGGQVAAEEAAKQSLAAQPGMFNMIPGVTQGSPQHLALLEQNAGLGGSASDLTAQAAKGALGKQSFLDSLLNTGKADLAGMSDPRVWADRLARNADRFAANAGRNMAKSYLTQGMGGPAQQPMAPPPRPQQAPAPQSNPDMYANTKGNDDFMREFEALSPEEKRRVLEKLMGRA